MKSVFKVPLHTTADANPGVRASHSVEYYDYELPRELIAQEPSPNRIDARLMVIDRAANTIEHHHVRDLPDLLQRGDTMVMNNSAVVPARLIGHRSQTGGRWQGLYLRSDSKTGVWEVLTKTRGTLKSGESISIEDRNGRDSMQLIVVARTAEGGLLVRPELPPSARIGANESFDPAAPAHRWLERFGRVPIPPYIRDGHMVDSDVLSYQTVYAKSPGSVAAPTAGLHFSDSLLSNIRQAGIQTTEVTLHVGIGTFRPIQVDDLNEHEMHFEQISVSDDSVAEITQRRKTGRTVAVGTTAVRVLESASQTGSLQAFDGPTNLFIRPPYEFRSVDALMTNFHLPKSSLLVMVAAFAGDELIRRAYDAAVAMEYRFYSYGDAMLIV